MNDYMVVLKPAEPHPAVKASIILLVAATEQDAIETAVDSFPVGGDYVVDRVVFLGSKKAN